MSHDFVLVLQITSLLMVGACASEQRQENGSGGGGLPGAGGGDGDGDGQTSTGAGGGGQDGGSDDGGGSDGGGDGDSGGSNTGDGSIRYDVGADRDGGVGPGDSEEGCDKVDFLFVVDNSGSMGDEQDNLTTSFPGFMEVIEDTLMAEDFHIMAVDTDAGGGGGGSTNCSTTSSGTDCTCQPAPSCCDTVCTQQGADTCNGFDCDNLPEDDCADVIGAGKQYSGHGDDCGLQSDLRYIIDGQPDLSGTFSCIARVGTFGDGEEQPMAAMVEAVSTALNEPGGCNEGFLRDDAVLVVTFMTDEEDDGKSPGDPASWKQAIVDAKHGNEEAVVVLGLVGDGNVSGGLPGGPCASAEEAEDSPVLQSFVDQFQHGSLGSICASDYSPFFEQAVSVIDTACDDFVPPQ